MVLTQELPDIFMRIEFRTLEPAPAKAGGGQLEQANIVRYNRVLLVTAALMTLLPSSAQ